MKGRLFNAALNGDMELVRSLLAKGANVNEVRRGKVHFSDHMVSAGGCTPLMAAVGGGHEEVATLLLDAGADPNRKAADDLTALHLAVAMNRVPMTRLLVRRSADIEARRHPAQTPLLEAVSLERFHCAIALIQEGAGIHVQGGYMQDTPLHLAVHTDDASDDRLDCIRELLKAGADVNARNSFRQTPLHYAAMGNAKILRLLLNHGADIEARDSLNQTPLHSAAGNPKAVRILLSAGSKVNVSDKFGKSPLYDAVRRHQTDVVRELIRAGADVNIKAQDGSTPLSCAETDSQTEICELLYSAGAKEDFSKESLDLRLALACKAGDLSRVRELLTRGASPDAAHEWKSALMYAVEGGHAMVVDALLDAGVEVRFSAGDSPTLLHRAAGKGAAYIVGRLLASGIPADIADCDGETPLLAACESGDPKTIRLLLQAGADPGAGNRKGMNPLLAAARYGHAEAVELIRNAGGKHKLESHFLEIVELEGRLKLPPFRKAIDEISELCETKPMQTPHLFRSGAFWDLSRSPLAEQAQKELEERYQEERLFVKGTDPAVIRHAATRLSEMHAVDAAVSLVQERAYDKFCKRGCLLLFVHQLPGNKLALLPTTNPYVPVAWLGPHPKGSIAMLEFLMKLANEWPWKLYGCSYDEIRLRFSGRPQRPADLTKRLFTLRCDERGIVRNGIVTLADTKKRFEELLDSRDPIIRLWWD